MDALHELYDPDAIMKPPEGWPESAPFVGRDAVIRQFEQMRSTWDADTLEAISDFIDSADRAAAEGTAGVTCRRTVKVPSKKTGVTTKGTE